MSSRITYCKDIYYFQVFLFVPAKGLNVSKTKYMCFHTSNKTVTYPKLKINNVTIDRVNDFKFLGLIISSNLKWNKHINHISIKVSKVIGIMFRLRTILPSDVLQTLYNSLIMPHFHYCLLTLVVLNI